MLRFFRCNDKSFTEYCEHEWIDLGFKNDMSLLKIVYCPKCEKQKTVGMSKADHYVKMSKLRNKYLESQQFDVLDERIKQLEMEMKK